ncbi:uncharacterized protein LOC113852657 [Abrus precatorius]|uniref:Uncharacterized protein LOC113852657 n=1 Tax=Abrus precatorius TaxID=3816 RepID=A0A8B8K554_ABRPR|nr:uncharacterized protein LOC113852657 [Abrus precatorius]
MGEESPKNKVKFLCSHGGKVLPRPSDGVLKYVGGETRVVSVPRDITFSELMKKLSSMFDGDMVLKYQLVPEDLDALVSVRAEEDLKHMIEEHDRHQTGLLRAFLFPPKPVVVENTPPTEAYLLEQRYIDAINGIVRTSSIGKGSACSTPKSTSPDAAPSAAESPFLASASSRLAMQRVRSSPSLTNLNDHTHHHQHALGYTSSTSRPPQDPQAGIGLGRPIPLGGSSSRGAGGSAFNYYYSPSPARPHNKAYAYQDDTAYGGHLMVERVHSVPRSPIRSIWE